MSYGIESKKLKRLVDFYSPFNKGQQLKFLSLFKGQQGLLRYLQASSFQGIDSTSIQERAQWFGTNGPSIPKQNNKLRQILLSPLNNFGMKVYLLFSIIDTTVDFLLSNKDEYICLGGIFNFVIFALIFLILLATQLCQYYENNKLRQYIFEGCRAKVWRDNEKQQIHSFDLVIGDVIQLQKGDKVGADGIIIEGNLTVREPMSYKQMTVQKCNTKQCLRRWAQFQDKITKFCLEQEDDEERMPSPIILGGSEVIKGDGRMVVLCVGRHSRVGHFVHEVHRSALEKKSEIEHRLHQLMFQLSKYLILATILLFLLYIVKTATIIISQKSLSTQNWPLLVLNLFHLVTPLLMGLPITQIFGLGCGLFYIRFRIKQNDGIWYKYVKDCGMMREVSTVVMDRIHNEIPLKLVKLWNGKLMNINYGQDRDEDIRKSEHGHTEGSQGHSEGGYDIPNKKYEEMLIKSLRSQNFQPYQVGLKIPSFFIGLNSRYIQYLQECLYQYAGVRERYLKRLQKHEQIFQAQSIIDIDESQHRLATQKELEIIYLKGNSQTILKECSHIFQPNGRVTPITSETRAQIRQLIYTMNATQESSLITGYIEVHRNHPKFRQPDYKIVMLSLISYKENPGNQEFQSLARVKKMGISVMLTGHCSHDQTVDIGKEMGIVLMDKPSIRLTGYDFHKIVGGIICKLCKKSTCMCPNENKYQPVLKNQDQFNRIYKHLNVLSETNSQDKQTLALGFATAHENTLFVGRSVDDVPAMRISHASAIVASDVEDEYVRSAAMAVLPNSNLATVEKMVIWSHFYYQFCRKYMVFIITPSLVAFITSGVSFLLFGNFCIQLLQFLWVTAILCPILGMTFVLGSPPTLQQLQRKNINKNGPFIDRINYRQISSQVFVQLALIFIVLIFGPSFIPEESDTIDTIIGDDWSAKYKTQQKLTICSGIYEDIFNNRTKVYAQIFFDYGIYSRHMTFIFNLFAFMQFVNYFNCMFLGNFFTNFADGVNIASVACVIAAVGLQVLVIFIGGSSFHLYPQGLTLKQWAICLGLSLIAVFVAFIVKQLPYDSESEEKNGKIWPNRCYNLAVMSTMPRQSLQDFEIDEELQVKKMAMGNQ